MLLNYTALAVVFLLLWIARRRGWEAEKRATVHAFTTVSDQGKGD
jgi:hypothetical protein